MELLNFGSSSEKTKSNNGKTIKTIEVSRDKLLIVFDIYYYLNLFHFIIKHEERKRDFICNQRP